MYLKTKRNIDYYSSRFKMLQHNFVQILTLIYYEITHVLIMLIWYRYVQFVIINTHLTVFIYRYFQIVQKSIYKVLPGD